MLSVKSIPAFNDNYIWLIHNNDNHCVVVDPGDATPVLECIKEHDFILDAILITHHHHDHIGGVPELVRQFPNVNVVGPENEPIPTLTHPVGDGDFVELFDEQFMVLGVPGHTNGHVAYVGDEKLFCGDALFSAGCGRLFEGTAEQMFNSLQKKWQHCLMKLKSTVHMNTRHQTWHLHSPLSQIMITYYVIEKKFFIYELMVNRRFHRLYNEKNSLILF